MKKVDMSERDFIIALHKKLLENSKNMKHGTLKKNLYNSSLEMAMKTGFNERDFDSDTHLVNVARTLNTERINTKKAATSEGKITHKEEIDPGIYVTEKPTYQEEFKQEFDKLSFTAEQSEYNSKMLAMYQDQIQKMLSKREEFISIVDGMNLPISEKTKIYKSFCGNILMLQSHLVTRHQIENRIKYFQHKQHEPAAESRYVSNSKLRDNKQAAYENEAERIFTLYLEQLEELTKKGKKPNKSEARRRVLKILTAENHESYSLILNPQTRMDYKKNSQTEAAFKKFIRKIEKNMEKNS